VAPTKCWFHVWSVKKHILFLVFKYLIKLFVGYHHQGSENVPTSNIIGKYLLSNEWALSQFIRLIHGTHRFWNRDVALKHIINMFIKIQSKKCVTDFLVKHTFQWFYCITFVQTYRFLPWSIDKWLSLFIVVSHVTTKSIDCKQLIQFLYLNQSPHMRRVWMNQQIFMTKSISRNTTHRHSYNLIFLKSSLNHSKKMKAELIRLIPRKLTGSLELQIFVVDY